jgi:hypothetical protein
MALLVLLAACSKPAAPPAAVTPPAPWDSLVLTLSDSTTVWLVRGRQGIASTGATCEERSVELRKGSRRTLVPLLYAREVPRLMRGTLYATLSDRCADVGEYVIDPATGYPTPVKPTR